MNNVTCTYRYENEEEYSMLNESVINVLKNGMWDLATCANGEPNVVPVAFKDVTDDGKLVVGDVFLETTLNNIKENDGKEEIIDRRSYDEIPPRVEYMLTQKGKSVVPILQNICQWSGIFYKEDTENEMVQCQKCDYHR